MKTVNTPNIIASGVVLNATRTSTAMQLFDAFVFSIQVVISGTPTGSLKLQASCDAAFSGVPGLPTVWTDVANSSTNVTAAGSVIWSITEPGYNWVRVVYTDTSSGSSTAIISSATFNSKGF